MQLVPLLLIAAVASGAFTHYAEYLCRDDTCQQCETKVHELDKCISSSRGGWSSFGKCTDDGSTLDISFYRDKDCTENVSNRTESKACQKFEQGGSFKFECQSQDRPDVWALTDVPMTPVPPMHLNLTITRADVMSRAMDWVNRKIPYCQCNGPAECCGSCPYCGSYRCDCSGGVSYWWNAGHGYVTSTFNQITKKITKEELQEGDALLNPADHVVLFAGWYDSGKTKYWAIQEPGCHTSGPHYAFRSVVTYPFGNDNAFFPVRYNSIS